MRVRVPRRGRAAAGPGVYLSYSRGALAVAVARALVLVALAPSRAQLRARGDVLGGRRRRGAPGCAARGVAALEGTARADGLVALVLLLAPSRRAAARRPPSRAAARGTRGRPGARGGRRAPWRPG